VIRGNAADPHVVELTREADLPAAVTSKIAAVGIGYVRISGIGANTASQVKSHVAELTKGGAGKLVIDVRRTTSGSLDDGLALARLFVSKGTLAVRETKGGPRETIAAGAGDGSIAAPAVLLIDTGTSGAAELFAAALNGNQRADLIGEHTIGRAAQQKLIKLPDGAGLWLSTSRFLTPSGAQLHEKGLEPTVAVEEPDVAEFGAQPPPGDPILDKALERLAEKKAA
jgi:carboxyl-terminal processing protease